MAADCGDVEFARYQSNAQIWAEDMHAIAEEVEETFGGLDTVFANAGRAFPSAVEDIDARL
ncbi:MAG: hypothetical protein P4M06_25015 [Pandoraea sp.]|nr:hypothetical protein [Pandoraea sp.]